MISQVVHEVSSRSSGFAGGASELDDLLCVAAQTAYYLRVISCQSYRKTSQPVDSGPGRIKSVSQFTVFMYGQVHVERSFVEEGEGLDEPEEHLDPRSVNHYIP